MAFSEKSQCTTVGVNNCWVLGRLVHVADLKKFIWNCKVIAVALVLIKVGEFTPWLAFAIRVKGNYILGLFHCLPPLAEAGRSLSRDNAAAAHRAGSIVGFSDYDTATTVPVVHWCWFGVRALLVCICFLLRCRFHLSIAFDVILEW